MTVSDDLPFACTDLFIHRSLGCFPVPSQLVIKSNPGNPEPIITQSSGTTFEGPEPEGMRENTNASNTAVDRNPDVLHLSTEMMPDLGLIARQDIHDGSSSLPWSWFPPMLMKY